MLSGAWIAASISCVSFMVLPPAKRVGGRLRDVGGELRVRFGSGGGAGVRGTARWRRGARDEARPGARAGGSRGQPAPALPSGTGHPDIRTVWHGVPGCKTLGAK
ncbi:hypothetical protein GCM10009802_06320 [Streptomyces synnematoformans]|uniref:Secreted protein n=1 Tax=Streptomyces synnematoformans TaxID=415721 RepID=A0ABP5J456_9ACTN